MTILSSLCGKPGVEDAPEAFGAALLKGFNLAIGDGSAGALHAALDVFAHAVLIDDTRPEPYLGLALSYSNLGDCARGRMYFDICLQHGFGDGDFKTLCYEQDDPAGETETFDISLDHVLIWRAMCHLEQNSTKAAREDLRRISGDPVHELRAGLSALQARLCLALDDPVGAKRHLSQAFSWDPDEPDAHFVRGCLHEKAGNFSAALTAYSRAIKLDPNEPGFRIARAELELNCEEPDKARQELMVAAQIIAEELPQPDKTERIHQLLSKIGSGTAL